MQLLPLHTLSRQPWYHPSLQQHCTGEPRCSLFLGLLHTQVGERSLFQVSMLFNLHTKALFLLSLEKCVLAIPNVIITGSDTALLGTSRYREPVLRLQHMSPRGPAEYSWSPKTFQSETSEWVSMLDQAVYICSSFASLCVLALGICDPGVGGFVPKILESVLYSWWGRLCHSTSVLSTAPAKCMPLVKINGAKITLSSLYVSVKQLHTFKMCSLSSCG